MLGYRREQRVSHGTAVQMAIKQAQVNNRSFLTSMAATEASAATPPLDASVGTYTHTGAQVHEVASNDAVLALRAGDRMIIVDHPDSKNSDFVESVELLMQKAHELRDKTPPWELEIEIGNTNARLVVNVSTDKKVTMLYMRDPNATPVLVDPVGKLDWKL